MSWPIAAIICIAIVVAGVCYCFGKVAESMKDD